MKKIIAAFDGLKYSESTKAYAIYLAKQTNTPLSGIFMDDAAYTSKKVYELINEHGVLETRFKKMEAKDIATRNKAATDFEKACRQEGLEHAIQHDQKIAIQELKHESIYADLLVIDSNETLINHAEKLPTRFIRDLLDDVQCPVLIVPEKYTPIEKIILLYDGEPSSVHAIKMFSYLLGVLKHMNTEVIAVNPADSSFMPGTRLMKEFIKCRYPNAKYNELNGMAETEIVKFLKKKQNANALVVLGAYSRGKVSRWIRESMADVLMKSVKLPLFIAHHK